MSVATVEPKGGNSAPNTPEYDANVPVDLVEMDPNNRDVDFAKVDQIAASIRAEGLLQPVCLRVLPSGKYRLIAGEHRWRAMQKLGRPTIAARIYRGEDELSSARKSAIENFFRAELTPIDQAKKYRELGELGMKQKEIGELLHKSQPVIANALRMLELPAAVQELLKAGKLSEAHGVALAKYSKWAKACEHLAQTAVEMDLSAKAIASGDIFEEVDDDVITTVRAYEFNWTIPPALKKDPDCVEVSGTLYCFAPQKYAAAVKEFQAKKRAEEAKERKRRESAPETQVGEVIPKELESLTELIPDDKLGKRKDGRESRVVCKDRQLWLELRGAHENLVMEDRKAKLPKLIERAWERLKGWKKIGPAEVALLLHADQYGDRIGTEDLGSKWAQKLGLPFAKASKRLIVGDGWDSRWNLKEVAKEDALAVLKLIIGKKVEEFERYDADELDAESIDFMHVLLGEPTLGLLEETDQGRKQLIEAVRAKLKLPSAAAPAAGKPAPPSKPQKKGGRK